MTGKPTFACRSITFNVFQRIKCFLAKMCQETTTPMVLRFLIHDSCWLLPESSAARFRQLLIYYCRSFIMFTAPLFRPADIRGADRSMTEDWRGTSNARRGENCRSSKNPLKKADYLHISVTDLDEKLYERLGQQSIDNYDNNKDLEIHKKHKITIKL